MKKLFYLSVLLLSLSCSKSDDNSNDQINTSTNISLPNWLNGTYKADNLGVISTSVNSFYYPTANPYSMTFVSGNDILIKGKSNSSTESLQSIINGYISSDKLLSVSQTYNTNTHTNYTISIMLKPVLPTTYSEVITYFISKPTTENKIHLIYNSDTQSYYTLQ